MASFPGVIPSSSGVIRYSRHPDGTDQHHDRSGTEARLCSQHKERPDADAREVDLMVKARRPKTCTTLPFELALSALPVASSNREAQAGAGVSARSMGAPSRRMRIATGRLGGSVSSLAMAASVSA